jgi:hypothetical protein
VTTCRRPRSISHTGYRAHVWCKACRHAKDADLTAPTAAFNGDVPLVQMRRRSGNCGLRLPEFIVGWYFWATHSRLPPLIDAARTVKRHSDDILRWFRSKIANGLFEGINSLIQAAKAKARGYRSMRNLTAMVYLIAGKLDLSLRS